MATKTFSLLPFLVLFLITGDAVPSCGSSAADELRKACSVTRYRTLCVRSLAAFSHTAGSRGPRLWARAAVSVALAESERTSKNATYLQLSPTRPRGAVRGALNDCAECLRDAVAELQSSLSELRRLQPRTFAWQMSNVETWVSAALTDQDTCLDGLVGLPERQGTAPALRGLKAKVLNTTHLCSNALALVHRLASSGGRT